MNQSCKLLVIKFSKPEGNRWGPVERCWGALGTSSERSLDLGETTTQPYIGNPGHAVSGHNGFDFERSPGTPP